MSRLKPASLSPESHLLLSGFQLPRSQLAIMVSKPRVALVPTPGMGHLIPLVELAKRLVLSHGLSATFIIPSAGPPPKAQMEILESLPEGTDYVLLPPVSFDDLPGNIRPETQIVVTLTRSVSGVRTALNSLIESTNLVAVIVDLFGTDLFEITGEFKVPAYIFFACSGMALTSVFYTEKLHKVVSCEFRDIPEPLMLPGCGIPVHGRDLPEMVQDRKNEAYQTFLLLAKGHHLAEGILLNSFTELEPETIQVLQEKESGNPPIYAVGPIIQSDSRKKDGGCLQWLDDQPSGSVLFVSFGSGGTLSLEQATELAMGLEMSGQRFLWVVRSPDDKSANASYFNAGSLEDSFAFLPEGFFDGIKGRGLLVPSWAPQIQVLSHSSTGGYLTHCGWNSTLESIVHGVPLIAWPLYAEQKLNAILLTKNLQVALSPRANEKGLVGREEIAKVVKSLMQEEEGARIRDRMNMLKDAAVKAVGQEGSSTKSLFEVVSKWNESVGS